MRVSAHADWSQPLPAAEFRLQGAHCWEHLSIVADARIDNLSELHRAHGLRGIPSVWEVLARSYLAWGDLFPERLSGDFAIVIGDSRGGRLIAARDPFGVKQLSYRVEGERVWIDNQFRSLIETFDRKPELDDQRIVEYLLGCSESTAATFFRDIRDVAPGHVAIATRSGVTQRRYWIPPVEGSISRKGDRRAYYEEFRRLFVQSVRRRTSSERPVLIHVSGGLDSSSIAGAGDVLMRDGLLMGPSVVGVSAQYTGLSCDETEYVDAMSDHLRYPIQRWNGLASDDADLIDPRLEQPGIRSCFRGGTNGDVSIARVYGSSVILNGTGGDQLGMVSGYVKDLMARRQWSQALSEILFFPDATMSFRFARVKSVLKQSLPPRFVQRVAQSRIKAPKWLTEPFKKTAARILSIDSSWSPARPSALPHVPGTVWSRLVSAQTLQNVSVLNAFANLEGVEYRFPYLDSDLIRHTLTIPSEYWPRPGPYARLHREALASLLPPKVVNRSTKAEFTPAVVNRIRRAESHIDSILQDSRWLSHRYVDQALARRRLARRVRRRFNPRFSAYAIS